MRELDSRTCPKEEISDYDIPRPTSKQSSLLRVLLQIPRSCVSCRAVLPESVCMRIFQRLSSVTTTDMYTNTPISLSTPRRYILDDSVVLQCRFNLHFRSSVSQSTLRPLACNLRRFTSPLTPSLGLALAFKRIRDALSNSAISKSHILATRANPLQSFNVTFCPRLTSTNGELIRQPG